MELVRKIQFLDQEFEMKFRKYLYDTEGRTADYSKLVSENIETSEVISRLTQKINNSKNKTQYWSLKIL